MTSEYNNLLAAVVPNGPRCYQITNKQFINYLTKTINFNYNIKSNVNFPAPQPVSIEKKDFEKLKKYEYNVSLKLDGTRFLMLFIKDKLGKNQCILVNRALKFFNLEVECEENMYTGTLLDGELMEENTNWTFYIHDALVLCGNKISKLEYSTRMMDAKCCIESFINNNNSQITIKTKDFCKLNEIDKLFVNNIKNDGVIFMPENLPVIAGTQYSMLKWKPSDKHTFDFLVIENGDNFKVQVYHLNELIDFANIYSNNENGKLFIDNTKALNNYSDKCIVECLFDSEKENFTPVLIRTDKTHPNSLRTIERTLFNINENIKLEDLKNLKED